VANQDYEIQWSTDDNRLLETGSVTLLLSSGESIRQVWSSIITPENRPDRVSAVFKKFPRSGKFNKNGMSYTWEGVVKRRSQPSESS